MQFGDQLVEYNFDRSAITIPNDNATEMKGLRDLMIINLSNKVTEAASREIRAVALTLAQGDPNTALYYLTSVDVSWTIYLDDLIVRCPALGVVDAALNMDEVD